MSTRDKRPLTEQEIEEARKKDPSIKEFNEAAQRIAPEDRYDYEYQQRQQKVAEARTRQADAQNLLADSKEWNKFRLDLSDKAIREIRKYNPLDEFDIEVDGQVKHYTRGKIRTRDYRDLEKIRGQFARETDEVRRSELQMEIYQKCALHYLGMTGEEFDGADFEVLKRIVDSCNLRTIHGKVDENPNSRGSSV